MMKTFGVAVVAAAVFGLQFGAPAHAANIDFSTSILSTCGISVTRDGTLVPRRDVRILTSSGAGGQNGLAAVTTNADIFQIHVDQPTAFAVRPVADTDPIRDFRARIRSRGATRFGWTTNSQNLNSGTSNVAVQFRARKARGNIFANGFYRATVVIRCE